MSSRLPEPPRDYSQTWASQTFRILERALSAITGLETTAAALPTTYQPLDATLTALAAANWAANALPIGTGADTISQTTFAANTFPARASTGNLVANTITDFGLSLVDDADETAGRRTLGVVIGTNVQAWSANLDEYSAVNPSADALLLLADTDVPRLGTANNWTGAQAVTGAISSRIASDGDALSFGKTGGQIAYGYADSIDVGIIDAANGGAGFSGFLIRGGSDQFNVYCGASLVGGFSGTGLAVTGALSATGKISSSVASGSNALEIASGARFYLDGGGDTYLHESSADVLAFVVGSGTRLTINATGAIYGTVMHNNATALTGTTNQYIGSGTWTPTITGVTNVAASTSASCQYIRVGNVVTCSGVVQIDPTSAAYTVFALSLPIASAFTVVSNLGGNCGGLLNGEAGPAEADFTNDRAQCSITLVNNTNQNIAFHFTYVVL